MLTEAEHKAVTLAGELMTVLAKEIIGHGITREADMNELVIPIHQLQHAIMGQAAGRLYPDKYRLLGEVINPICTCQPAMINGKPGKISDINCPEHRNK